MWELGRQRDRGSSDSFALNWEAWPAGTPQRTGTAHEIWAIQVDDVDGRSGFRGPAGIYGAAEPAGQSGLAWPRAYARSRATGALGRLLPSSQTVHGSIEPIRRRSMEAQGS